MIKHFPVRPNEAIKLDQLDFPDGSFGANDVDSPEVTPLNIQTLAAPSVNLYDKLIARPRADVRLGDINPNYHGNYDSPETALPETRFLLRQLDYFQYLMHAEKRHSLLIVLQGLDASGKDAVIRHILSGVNPVGSRVISFKEPTPEELAHDFLWRVHVHLPAKGQISIFNRSHYEDVLIVRVHHLDQVTLWSKRYHMINEFERLLVMENNTTVLKFLLYISKEEQLARFRQRLEDPARHWKISEADYREREHWNRYIEAFEDMLRNTSTVYAPWFVIPSNCKWFRDLAISQIIVRTLENLQMRWPEPSANIADILMRYHRAEVEAAAS